MIEITYVWACDNEDELPKRGMEHWSVMYVMNPKRRTTLNYNSMNEWENYIYIKGDGRQPFVDIPHDNLFLLPNRDDYGTRKTKRARRRKRSKRR